MENRQAGKLLFENNGVNVSKFKINQTYADRFKKRKERELIDKHKAKYGEQYQEYMEEENDNESDSNEDENGQLVNDQVTDKFIETIAKIRMKHPDIYDKNKEHIFKEDDHLKHNDRNEISEEKITYDKTQIKSLMKKLDNQEDIDDSSNDEKRNKNKILTHHDEQINLKNEFKIAAKDLDGDGDALLQMKQKTAQQINDEQVEFNGFLSRMQNNKKPKNEIDILKRFWGKDSQVLDEKDRFLRKFILTKGWIDRDDIEDDEQQKQDSEEYEEQVDNYEEKYNFRYEQPGGLSIITYERQVDGIIRENGNVKRQEQRKLKNERVQNQKKQLQEELEQLKIAKKEQLIDRINKIYEVGAIKQQDSQRMFQNITEEFDEKTYDRAMNSLYDDPYYDQQDSEEQDIKDDIDEFYDQDQIKEIKPKQSNIDEAIENALDIKQQIPLMLRKNLKDEQLKAIQDDGRVNIWWYCDNCTMGIQPLQQRFDCQECQDYTLCKKCYDAGIHQQSNHKFKKQMIPRDCIPPSQEEINKIIAQFKMCQGCEFKLSDENDYYQSNDVDTGEDIILCEECFQDQQENQEQFIKINASKVNLEELLDDNPLKLKQKLPDNNEIQKLVDDYYNLDFEDVIAGGLKTRFNYIETEPQDYGLTDDNLLYCDDALLNQYISIKKLFPYNTQPVKMKPSRQRQMLNLIEKSTKKNKKLIFKEQNKIQRLQAELQEIKKEKNPKKQKLIDEIQQKIEKIENDAKIYRGSGRKKQKLQQGEQPQLEVEIEEPLNNEIDLPQNRLEAYGLDKQKSKKNK